MSLSNAVDVDLYNLDIKTLKKYIITQKSKMADANVSAKFKKLITRIVGKQDNCIILTVISMFSRSRNSLKLFSILCGANGSLKFKMATHKQGILMIVRFLTSALPCTIRSIALLNSWILKLWVQPLELCIYVVYRLRY